MLNVAVLGCGWAGQAHIKAYQRNSNAKVVAVFGIPIVEAEKVAIKCGARAYDDFDKIFNENNIDIVDICLPTYLHFEYLKRCISKNVHILCEKPFCLTYEQAIEIEGLLYNYSKKVMVGYVTRFFNAYEIAKRLTEERKYGKMLSAYLYRLSVMPPWSSWFRDERLSGGGILDLHIHDLDFASWLLGYPSRIYSIGNKIKDSNNWVQAFTIFRYQFNGCHSAIEVNQNMPGYFPFTFGFRITFEEAVLIYNYTAPEKESGDFEPCFYGILKIYDKEQGFGKEIKLERSDPYEKEIHYFIDRIVNDEPVELGSVKDAVLGMKLVEAVRNSLENNIELSL